MRSSFARVRRYLLRQDMSLWLVYVCGFLSGILWPPLVVLGAMITELLVTAGNLKQSTALGLLFLQYPALQSNELCLVVLLGVALALGSLECLLLYALERSAKAAALAGSRSEIAR